MKTLAVLLMLGVPSVVWAADDGESLLKLLQHPSPALKAVMEDSQPARQTNERDLARLAAEAHAERVASRATRAVAVDMAAGPAMTVGPGQTVDLR